MPLQSIGDMAQSFAMRRQSIELNRQMDRLTQELSSGKASDIPRHLAGHLLQLADVERDLTVLEARKDVASVAATDAGVMQTALDRIQTATGDLATNALTAGFTAGSVQVPTVANEARAALETIIGALNTDVAGRAVFAGNRTDTAPLADADILLDGLRAALAGASDTTEIRTRLDTFFDDPAGGFATSVYQGGAAGLTPRDLGAGESVALDIRADDAALRGVMKQTALIAMLDDASLGLSLQERRDLAGTAGERLLEGQDKLTGLRANLGFAEERITKAESRISAGLASLTIARNDLISVDTPSTAVELEQVQSQLEMLYTLTARSARLSLVNFLS
ncbi:flagellin [Roseovarius sp. D22-M7]|uniref:flagellin n=1 Tax=Roseovarius sp. D22-M7 TaxID=3127116 RepID=UPI0030100784